MKRHPLAWRSTLEGRAVACLFEHPATRGRVSLEVAVHRLGALPVVLRRGRRARSPTPRTLALVVLRRDRGAHGPPPGPARARRARVGPGRSTRAPIASTRAGRSPTASRCASASARCPGWRSRTSAPRAGDALADRGRAAGGHDGAPRGAAGAPARPGAARPRGQRGRTSCERSRATPSTPPRPAELPDAYAVTPELLSFAAPGALVLHATPTSEQAANLLPVEQAVLRALVTGDWEALIAGDNAARAWPPPPATIRAAGPPA